MTWEHKELAAIRAVAQKRVFYRPEAPVESATLVVMAFFGLAVVASLIFDNLFYPRSDEWSWAIQRPWSAILWASFGLVAWFRERNAYRDYTADKQTYDVAAAAYERDKQLGSAK